MFLATFVGLALVVAATDAADSAADAFGNVAFAAVFAENTEVAGGRVVKFPKVYTNHGSSYSSDSGIFLATKPGLYAFHINGQAQPGEDFAVTLYLNDNPIISVSGRQEGNNAGTASNSVTLRLKKNDRVYVKADTTSAFAGAIDRIVTTFVGYLIGSLTGSEF